LAECLHVSSITGRISRRTDFHRRLSAPARATVVVDYALTFTGSSLADDGTGTLVLNLQSLPDNNAINFTSLQNSIFSSTATIGNASFTLTNANIAFGGIQGTNSSSVDVAMTDSTAGLANGTQYLALFNDAANAGTFQIQEVNVGGTFPSGTFTIGSPVAAAVPEPSAWAMMILGFGSAAFMAHRRKHSGAASHNMADVSNLSK
jgi:hypothetical protein